VFPSSFKWFWPEWNYRAKHGIGILEFFLDLVSFNPNDEFGDDSLLLCSPIASSFGYTFTNEAKLINFDHLISMKELDSILSNRYCKSDLDCVYTDECLAKCDLSTNKCTSDLVKPQIAIYCTFLKDYLKDNMTEELLPILSKCENLNFIKSDNDLYEKNEMPLSFEKHKIYLKQSHYWKSSLDFALVTNKLRTTLWEYIKFVKDPIKSTKKTTKAGQDVTTTTTIPK
jgi:hypothetical protein